MRKPDKTALSMSLSLFFIALITSVIIVSGVVPYLASLVAIRSSFIIWAGIIVIMAVLWLITYQVFKHVMESDERVDHNGN
jgi:hypothetical protein